MQGIQIRLQSARIGQDVGWCIGMRAGGRATRLMGSRASKTMRHAALERQPKTLRRQIPFRRRGPLLQKAPRHVNRNELSCRAGRHMRLRDRNLAEPLQKMIPEFPSELPDAIAPRASSLPSLCASVAAPPPKQKTAKLSRRCTPAPSANNSSTRPAKSVPTAAPTKKL